MVISNYYLSLTGKDSYPSFFTKIRKDSWTKLEREAIEKFIKQENEKST